MSDHPMKSMTMKTDDKQEKYWEVVLEGKDSQKTVLKVDMSCKVEKREGL